jgi:hypothetical protein
MTTILYIEDNEDNIFVFMRRLIGKPEVRQRLGGELRLADFLIRTLCRAAKCRAAAISS